ncbi:MAG: 16S rRNA (guanine(527)-N(7))-methyltransferase RsmG [Gammaproteobacteria bacterium]|nr:16S rRNA (guanine(527)-N(7))-methyltransferase RsmG [Gammaproteobacteria bacterium]
MDHTQAILQGSHELGLKLSLEECALLNKYLQLVQKWNRSYNLVSPNTLDELVQRHLLDCLALAPQLLGVNVVDFGSGAGFPGIPLAILFPDKNFTLIESNGKKARFLIQAKIELGLLNLTVINSRIETLTQRHEFDTVVSRAFASISRIVELSEDLLQENGVIACLKGKDSTIQSELEAFGQQFEVSTIRLNIPGLDEERNLVLLRKDEQKGLLT